MTVELKVHPSFFREFATKTWISPNEIVKELIENAFDEDATLVLITLLKDGSIVIEDDAGMNVDGMEKFLLLGSPHKRYDSISPKLKRFRTGRYGTGRLSFLTSFQSMKIKTKRDGFTKCIIIDATVLDKLFVGNTTLPECDEPSLKRNGTELLLRESKIGIDAFKLSKEIRKLAVLRQPMFEVFIKTSQRFVEWDFAGAEPIKPPEIQGHRIPFNLDNSRIIGEIIMARRPLSDDEKGIAVMVGNHIVTRSNFGFDSKLSRVTGFVRCDSLTSRFADKSALIEDEEYTKFYQLMKSFIMDTVLPSLNDYEDVLITREESKIYKEIDKVLGQAIVDNLETEEVEGYETIEVRQQERQQEILVGSNAAKIHEVSGSKNLKTGVGLDVNYNNRKNSHLEESIVQKENSSVYLENKQMIFPKEGQSEQYNQQPNKDFLEAHQTSPQFVDTLERGSVPGIIKSQKVRRPILKKTFALKRVGYKVIPYEDESDSRSSFTNENIVFVNKANSTYRAEIARGEEFLLRHIIGIVAEAIAESKHPEGKNALELQNRLIADAIRIHDSAINRK
jgi:Histidine kinase-, DNA gyrase B-, and HSP90-like ATPase